MPVYLLTGYWVLFSSLDESTQRLVSLEFDPYAVVLSWHGIKRSGRRCVVLVSVNFGMGA